MAPPWVNSSKNVTRNRRKEHATTSSLPPFNPPPSIGSFSFAPGRLFASIARCNALTTAKHRISRSLTQLAKAAIEELVDDNGANFSILNDAADLGDARLANLSHDVGAGVANLYMDEIGYTWVANAKEVLTASGKKPDYIYDQGSGSNHVVVMEAKGGIGPSVTISNVDRRTEIGYQSQVAGWLGQSTSKGQTIVHGYAVGTCAPAGGSVGEYVIHETDRTTAGSGPASGNAPSAPIALANYQAVFALMGAYVVENFVAQQRGTEPRTTALDTEDRFAEIDEFGTSLLVASLPVRAPEVTFAIEANVGNWFLDYLEKGWPEEGRVEPPVVSDDVLKQAREFPGLAIFRDGLALVRAPSDIGSHVRRWDKIR